MKKIALLSLCMVLPFQLVYSIEGKDPDRLEFANRVLRDNRVYFQRARPGEVVISGCRLAGFERDTYPFRILSAIYGDINNQMWNFQNDGNVLGDVIALRVEDTGHVTFIPHPTEQDEKDHELIVLPIRNLDNRHCCSCLVNYFHRLLFPPED